MKYLNIFMACLCTFIALGGLDGNVFNALNGSGTVLYFAVYINLSQIED